MARLLVALLCLVLSVEGSGALRIVASNHPLTLLAAAAAGPDTDLQTLMTPLFASPGFQLGEREQALLDQADLLVWNGPEAEPWLAPWAATPRAGLAVVTFSTLPGIAGREYRLDPSDPAGLGPDRHLWLSTRNAALLVEAVSVRLGNDKAALHFQAEMERFRTRQEARFSRVASRGLLSADDAFGYLLAEVGVTQVRSLAGPPGAASQPGGAVAPSRLSLLAAQAEVAGPGCVIGPPGLEQGPATLLLPGGHGHLVAMDPYLGGVGPGSDGYIHALIQLADTLYGCLATR